MPLFQLFKLLLAGFILSQLACKCDGRVDCERNVYHAEIRLVRDGKNAVFGSEAFIDQDSILILSPGPLYPRYVVTYIDSTESLKINVLPNMAMILVMPGRQDTLICTTMISETSECCVKYAVASLQWNGEELCTDDCTEIFEIEI